jgi:hypothetical protein
MYVAQTTSDFLSSIQLRFVLLTSARRYSTGFKPLEAIGNSFAIVKDTSSGGLSGEPRNPCPVVEQILYECLRSAYLSVWT